MVRPLENGLTWMIFEQLQDIAMNGPVSPGDLISKSDEATLRLAGLVVRNDDGYSVLSQIGWNIWNIWESAQLCD